MAPPLPPPGRVAWLEINAQRVTDAVRFYRDLFAWGAAALHVPPWGSIPLIANQDRVFANQFMAMGAFSTPQWNVWFSGDLEAALDRIPALGGETDGQIKRIDGHSEEVQGRDPTGRPFNVIRLLEREVPARNRPGEPETAEFWGAEARRLAPFYAGVLGLESEETAEGACLRDAGEPRLFLRQTAFDIQPPRWIPYFRSVSVGGDEERARRAGAVVQVPRHTVPGLGELTVLADPANACFGLLDPAPA
ncbi:MAG: hypothetical protein AAF074_02000 [Pseudomonadota bacterium]